jgi:hypothetical protein
VHFTLTVYFAMKIRRYRNNFSSTLGLRLSTLVMCGCVSVVTSTNCVDKPMLTCEWALLSPLTNFAGLHVTLTETQRKAAINSKF